MSKMNIFSDDLELALEKLSLEVEGTDAEDDLDIQTQEDFALMDTAMELGDKLIILKGTLAKTMEQKEISKVTMYQERLTEMMKTQYEQLQQIITVTSTQISDKEQGEQLLKRCQQIQLNHIKANQEFKTVSNCMSEKQNSAEVEPNIEDKRQSVQDMKQNVTTEVLKEQCIKHKENKRRNKPKERRRRKERNRERIEILALLRQTLKYKKHGRSRKQKRTGDQRQKHATGVWRLQKLKNWGKSLILRKQKNKQKKQSKFYTKRNLQNRRKSRKQKKQTAVDRNQLHEIWHRTRIHKSEKTPNG